MGAYQRVYNSPVMAFDRLVNLLVAAGALLAWRAAVRTHRGSIRPVVRPVRYRPGSPLSSRMFLILKNVGRGPALAVALWDERRHQVICSVDVVEPLGGPLTATGGESDRIGRVEVELHANMLDGVDYRIFYQDLTGAWHETRFRLIGDETFRVKHHGRLMWFTSTWVLREILDLKQVASLPE
jgi:hypothetical protein